jgi:hypothetical protein
MTWSVYSGMMQSSTIIPWIYLLFSIGIHGAQSQMVLIDRYDWFLHIIPDKNFSGRR